MTGLSLGTGLAVRAAAAASAAALSGEAAITLTAPEARGGIADAAPVDALLALGTGRTISAETVPG